MNGRIWGTLAMLALAAGVVVVGCSSNSTPTDNGSGTGGSGVGGGGTGGSGGSAGSAAAGGAGDSDAGGSGGLDASAGSGGDASIERDGTAGDSPHDADASADALEAASEAANESGACDGGTNFDNDPLNCGACGNVCNSTNGTASCSAGACGITCSAGYGNCDGNVANGCEVNLKTSATNCNACGTVCNSTHGTPTCAAGACGITCNTGFSNCDGSLANGCETVGPCPGPSCTGLAATCGATGNTSCCLSSVVTGGTFKRSYDAVTYTDQNYPATVSDFRMDIYEITVGRFRKFVDAGMGTQENPPVEGSGIDPNVTGSGWQAVAWNPSLVASTSELKKALKSDLSSYTWTDTPGSNENRPINLITWFEAFAFCIWDGGRLPTEAEWNYAAAGGGGADGQRAYPWSVPPTSTKIDCTYANYRGAAGPTGCSSTGANNVGSESPKGNGKWGHADMAGNVWEWVLDSYASSYSNPCTNCVNLAKTEYRMIRGGGFGGDASSLLAARRDATCSICRNGGIGARCVRTP